MSAKQFIFYMMLPGYIVGLVVLNTGFTLPAFDNGETVCILGGTAALIGYLVYIREIRRRSAMAEMKAETVKAVEEMVESIEQANVEFWDSHFNEVMSWGEGVGCSKEVSSPWA